MIGRRGRRWFAKAYMGHGKYKWLGSFDTRKEAKAALQAFGQRRRPAREETCASFAERWLESYPRPAPGTHRTYASAAKRFAEEFKSTPLADVDRLRAREWALDAPASVIAAVRAMFTDAMNDGLVITNPFSALGLKRSRGRKDIKALTEPELESLALTASTTLREYGPTFANLITVAGYTGMRAGELCALERSDLDLGKSEIHVRRALDRTGHVGPPKNGKPRTITCPPKARQALLSVPPRVDNDLVFLSPRGAMLNVGTINYYFRQVRTAFKKPDLQFHALRHACATILLERGVSHSDCAVQLGHADGGRLCMELYGHPTETGARTRLKGVWAEPTLLDERRQRRAANDS